MIDQDDANLEIFNSAFASGQHDFDDWLKGYLSRDEAYPFLLGGPRQYDLGDLLRALWPPANQASFEILLFALEKNIKVTADGFDLNALSTLAHAVARAGLSSATHSLALAIEAVLLKLDRGTWSEEENAAAFLAIDRIVAALATFAFDGDTAAIRVSRVLFEQDDLAPFASALFTPLALACIKNWPRQWKRLVLQAGRPAVLFRKEPGPEWVFSLGDQPQPQPAHFDIFRVFEDFLGSAPCKGCSLQEIYDAANAPGLKGRRKQLAEAVLRKMESDDRRAIIRPRDDSTDTVYLSPWVSAFDEARRLPKEMWKAVVQPEVKRNWNPQTGRTPAHLEQYLRPASA